MSAMTEGLSVQAHLLLWMRWPGITATTTGLAIILIRIIFCAEAGNINLFITKH